MPSNLLTWIFYATLDFLENYDKQVVSLSTIVLALATICLWFATRQLVREGQRSSERQLRAYIAVLNGALQRTNLREGPGVLAHVALKNSGQTPGYKFTTWINITVAPSNLEPPFGPPLPLNQRTGQSIIGPGADVHLVRGHLVSEDELQLIRAGAKAVFLWGGADYTDAFGKSRTFRFRCMMAGPETQSDGWSLKPHPLGYEGN